MIKHLTEQDRDKLLGYIGLEPEVNIFFLGDIENFGIRCDEADVWANETNGAWDFVVLRYLTDYVIYSQSAGYDAAAMASLLKSQKPDAISGKGPIVARLQEFFPERHMRAMFLTKCSAVKTDFKAPGDVTVRLLTPDDAEEVVDMMLQIDEFKQFYVDRASSIHKMRTSLSKGGSRIGAFKDGALVSTAATSAENSMSAMVVGVATRPGVRGRGYASAVVSELCAASLRSDKKFLCLFYDNPQAGRIYNKIGFEPFGEYALLK